MDSQLFYTSYCKKLIARGTYGKFLISCFLASCHQISSLALLDL